MSQHQPLRQALAGLALSSTALTLAVLTAAPSIVGSVLDEGLRAAEPDTVGQLLFQAALLGTSTVATLVALAVLLTELMALRPGGRLSRSMPARLRRATTRLAGLSLATGAVLGTATTLMRSTPASADVASGSDVSDDVAVMAKLDPTSRETYDHATMHQLGDRPTPTAVTSRSSPAAPPTEPDQATWQVQPGDSFWSIASDVLAESHPSSTPAETDIRRYWLRLIDANRDQLMAPANPDLLHVGQVLILPRQ